MVRGSDFGHCDHWFGRIGWCPITSKLKERGYLAPKLNFFGTARETSLD